MRKKIKSIPVNAMASTFGGGIAIERTAISDLQSFQEGAQAHRHDLHSFFLLEKGTVSIEIDFKKYIIQSPSVIYMHPNQVHLIMELRNVVVSSWAISNENLSAEYLNLLESIAPAKPLVLSKETFFMIFEAVSLGLKFSERKQGRLYHSLLRDSCTTLVALVISLYLEQSKSADKLSRFETVTKAFYEVLERSYITTKSPSAYAKKLNLSTPYLNECVKSTTGYSVSYHIQQRITLEAKRLLYHSDQSVKEIAAALGYDDYPYFSRMFTKVAGMTALAFRNKNLA